MKKLVFAFLLVAGVVGSAAADSTTPRLGLIKPSIGSTGWGNKLLLDLDYTDAKTCAQDQDNTFTGTNNFLGPVNLAALAGVVVQPSVTINSNTVWNGDRLIPAGSTITVTFGHTLTISGRIYAGRYQIFAASGTVAFGIQAQGYTYPEWFGAKGDGSTNDTLAIQQAINAIPVPYGGKVDFGPKIYATSATLTVPYGHTVLSGANREWFASGGTRILNLSTSNDILHIYGADLAHALQMNTVENIGLGRNTTTDATGIGISIRFANTTRLENVTVENCAIGVKAYSTSNLFIKDSFITRPVTTPAGNSFGIYLDAADTGNVSARLSHNIISFQTPPHSGTSYGIYLTGATMTDLFLEHNDISWADYGIYLQATSNTVLNSQDIHLIDNIVDSYVSVGYYLQGIDAHGTAAIIGGWTAPVTTGATTYGIQIYQCSGVTVTGHQTYGYLNYAHHTGIAVQNSTGCALGQNIVRDSVTGINMTTAQDTVLIGNSIYAASASPGTYGIQFVGSSSNTVSSNNLYGYITNGITLDASSVGNVVSGNSINTANITTPITDLGSGNSLYLQNLSAGALSVNSLGKVVSGTTSIGNGGTNSGTALSGSSIMLSNGSAIVQGAAGTSTTLLHGNASGSPTYGAASLTADVSGVLPVANGGNNSSTALSGSSIMVSNGSAVVQGAAGTSTTLLHGNASGAPTYGAASLTADVSGTLPIANGGTNSSTALSGSSIMVSDGSKIAQGAAGTSTTVLHGNASGAPTYGAVSLTGDVTGTLPVANGGTGLTGAAWTTYTPTVAAWIAGSVGTSTATARSQTIGKTTCVSITVTFSGTVTATGFTVSLPNSAQSIVALPGWVDVTGGAVQGISNVSGAGLLNGYNVAGGAFTPTTAYKVYFNGCYENQ